jgi:dihydropteroate synthase
MAQRSKRSSRKGLPRARLLSDADESVLLACGVDPASLPYLIPKLCHKNLLVEGVKLYAANILKQSMLSIGGDVAVHRQAVSGRVETSNCVIMGDLRHYRQLVDKLKLQPGLEPLAESIREQVFPLAEPLILDLCRKMRTWERLPVIIGILNVTPDSFSDGVTWLNHDAAIEHALEMTKQDADIIDVGGESSRPSARPVDEKEEKSRVLPVIEELASRIDLPISIDTTKATVAEAALAAGATIINDITALTSDPKMMALARESGCGVILMHMRGTPQTMQQDTTYSNIIREIYAFLDERIETCLKEGISPSSIIVDPGIGFGKDMAGNLSLLRHIAEFKSLGMPVLLGHSRKAFIGKILDAATDDREEGTDAITAWSTIHKVDLVRVHNVLHATRLRAVIRSIMEAA